MSSLYIQSLLKFKIIALLVANIIFTNVAVVKASHLLGADLSYECVGLNQYRISLKLYRDCMGIQLPITQTVTFRACGANPVSVNLNRVSGYPIDITPVCPTVSSSCSSPTGNYGVQSDLFQGIVTLPSGCNNIVFTFESCCRSNSITTLTNPGNQNLAISATLNNTLSPCNNSPKFLNDPTIYICRNQQVFYNNGGVDPDRDSLRYSLVNCMSSSTNNIAYNLGFSGTSPLTTASGVYINPITGAMTFTPTAAQGGVICVRVDEYRNGTLIGSTVRDIQVTVLNCNNALPTIVGVDSTGSYTYTLTDAYVGRQLCFDITGLTSNPALTVNMGWNAAIPAATFTTTQVSNVEVVGRFCWTPTSVDTGMNTFTVMLRDNACPIVGQRIVTYNINVKPRTNGLIWQDLNNNCIKESSEQGYVNGINLLINPGNIVVQSNAGEYYVDSLPVGTYSITVDTTNFNWILTCPVTQTFSVIHPDSTVIVPNFGFISASPCPSPVISLEMPTIRRGNTNQSIYVQACNEWTATEILDSAYAIITVPAQITVQNASLPYTALGNNRFKVELGDINPGQCIYFNLSTTVSLQAVANQTLCMSAELFPQAACVFDTILTPYQNNPSASVTPCTLPWDQSSLRVEGSCVGDSVRFVVYNTGTFSGGDMDCFAPVRVYVDGQWIMFDSIRINGGDSVVFMVEGTGGTMRLEADQHPLHPGNSRPNASVENCGNGNWTPGIINTMPQNDADPIIDIFCGQVTAPYDPNDKTGFPLGVGSNHNIRQNQQIEYLIRFQNVGTDTAVNVVIRDTLTTDLNIFTVQSGVASHPYEFRMYGPRVLEWRFNNILLPDSSTNEPESKGFVKFTVDQNPDLAFGTVIENSAAIYFDFEAPVITNTYFHTIHNFTISIISSNTEEGFENINVKVIPNPFHDQAILALEGLENTENLELEIFNISGQRVQNLNNSQNAQFQLRRGEMSQGIYFFSIRQGGKIVARGKMVVK